MRQVSVEGEACLRDAPGLASALIQALAEGGATVDLGRAVSLDASILQVLLSGHRSAAALGVPLVLADPGHPALCDALRRHGFVAADGSALTPDHAFWTGQTHSSEEA